jgi:phosphatidylinositol alpha-1,6-mannosyltransferase
MTEPAGSVSPAAGVLLITRNLPPLLGGMERLNLHLALELRQKFEVMVVGPVGSAARLREMSLVREVPYKPLWRFLATALVRAAGLARKYRPACIIAGSGLTAPMAFVAARLCGASSAVYVHGLDLVASHPVYRWIWHPFLRRIDLCIANSNNTAGLAASIGVPEERISVLHPGVELPDSDDASSAAEFRRLHGLDSHRVLLSVGRMTPRKGLLEFIDKAFPAVTTAFPDATLVIIGDEAPDALAGSAAGVGKRIMELARRNGLENNIRLLGACEESVLSAAYRAADVLVFPLRHVPGDVEGFGMVAIEAASYGLPTVAFSVGGIADAVADGRSGWLVPPDDYSGLAERLNQVLAEGRSEAVRRRCRAFSERFEWSRFGENLRGLITQLHAASQH